MERLSSSFTFVYKFVLPAWFGVGLSIMTIGGLIDGDLAALAGIPLAALLYFLFLRRLIALKRVSASGDGLVVSNYRDEVAIPYAQIAGVQENWFGRERRITLDLKTPCRFGSSVSFVPYSQMTWPWNAHPVATLLYTRVKASQA